MFEFDPTKSEANKAKHGIDFVEAQALWDDPLRRMIEARVGPRDEPRGLVIGRIGDPIWSAVITWRNGIIRLISVRRAREDEKELYYGQDD